MTTLSRVQMWLGVDVGVVFGGLLNCTFLTEMTPPMSKHVFNLESLGGNGMYRGKVE
jgi:hypothetical protein